MHNCSIPLSEPVAQLLKLGFPNAHEPSLRFDNCDIRDCDHPKKLLSKKLMHETVIKIVVAVFLALFGKIVALLMFKPLATLNNYKVNN